MDESDVHDAQTNVDPIVEGDGDGRRLEALTARRALAEEAERGIEAARLEDPDIEDKDSDLRLLQV